MEQKNEDVCVCFAESLAAYSEYGLATHHLDGRCTKVQVRNRCAVALQDQNPFPGQHLHDRLMALERGGLIGAQDQPADPAVQLSGEQQADDGRLDVLLLILVCVEGVSQVYGDVIWNGEELQSGT